MSHRLLGLFGLVGISATLVCCSGGGASSKNDTGGSGSMGGRSSSGGSGAGSGSTGGMSGAGGTGGSNTTGGAGGSGAGPTAGAGGGAAGRAGASNAGGSGSGSDGGPVVPKARAACTAPAGYRNLFSEVLGQPAADVEARMKSIVEQLFHGTGQDQAIYFELSSNPSQAYIEDIANNDVRSEGQSYGMFIAVEMNMQAEFDKLWSYAKSCMQQPSGVFAWQMNVNSCSPISTGQAPDGDEYFAEALMLAHKRWGDGGAINYGTEALKVMAAVAKQDFNSNPAVVKFSAGSRFSDPSYVLPLFYSEWACFDTANATLWNDATTYARTFFPKVINATTGLAPYQANYDGSAYSAGNTFNADSWRVPMNVMSDYVLNGAGTWQPGYAATNAAFWTSQGLDTYGGMYSLTGTSMDQYHGAGLTGVNAMLAFGLSAADGTPLLQAAWDQGTPAGQYRYYDGMLYMLSMLYLTGSFDLFY